MDDIDYLPGARVLGRYRGGEFGFPGIVERADPHGITVQYDDGDREMRPAGDVRPLGWHPGTRIDALWSGNGQWYGATIIDISDRRVAVRFDDGIEEETETARCRMPWTGPAPVEPGQRVLGRWRGGDRWFPAVVRGVGDGIVALDYDDGDHEELPADAVRLLDWEVGTRIEAIWSGNGHHYEASIVDIAPDGSSLTVRFDDGIIEETVTARCRQA